MKFEDYPETLDPIHIQKILNIGRRGTYEFLQNPPFHVVRVGRLIKISKQVFFEWYNGECEVSIIERSKFGDATKIKWNNKIYAILN